MNPPTPKADTRVPLRQKIILRNDPREKITLPARQASLDHHLHGIALTARPHHGEAVVPPG